MAGTSSPVLVDRYAARALLGGSDEAGGRIHFKPSPATIIVHSEARTVRDEFPPADARLER